MIPAIEQGYQQREIAKSASAYQSRVDNKESVVVGVNKFKNEIYKSYTKEYKKPIAISSINSDIFLLC